VPSPRRSVVPFPAAASRSLPAVASPAIGFGYQTPTVLSHAVPLGETDVERHESVHAVDGEIGRVEGFVVDPADNRVTHVLLQEGHMWSRKEVAIPVTWRARPLKAQVATLRDRELRTLLKPSAPHAPDAGHGVKARARSQFWSHSPKFDDVRRLPLGGEDQRSQALLTSMNDRPQNLESVLGVSPRESGSRIPGQC
jgi:hypothetical protein